MSEFIWKDQYNIGHPTVDAQHKSLFELANKILDANDSETLMHLFMLFYKHVREHFEAEEQLMKDRDYPGFWAHVQTHNQMLDKLNVMSQSIADRQWQTDDISAFVGQWILVHILEEDKPLGNYLELSVKAAKQHRVA